MSHVPKDVWLGLAGMPDRGFLSEGESLFRVHGRHALPEANRITSALLTQRDVPAGTWKCEEGTEKRGVRTLAVPHIPFD